MEAEIFVAVDSIKSKHPVEMKVLFIGGTGNISEACAELLSERGHEVSLLTRGRNLLPAGYRCVQADRHNPMEMRAALKDVGAEIVINFLGYDLPELEVDYALFKGRVRQYVFISSATVYAKPPPRLPITEDGPFGNPFWDYAAKKLACERWLQEREIETEFPVTIVRPSHTYSRRWIPNPVSSSSYVFARRLEQGRPVYVHDAGETPWTLTHAKDFAVGLAGLLGNPQALGQAFHITGDEVHTWNQIYHEIATALGVSLPDVVRIPTDFICRVAPQFSGTLRGDKAHPGIFDNSKIKRVVPEFGTRISLAAGLRESVEWLRAHPEHQNLNPDLDRVIDKVVESWRKENPAPSS